MSDSIADYERWIIALKKRARPKSLSEWEYDLWNEEALILTPEPASLTLTCRHAASECCAHLRRWLKMKDDQGMKFTERYEKFIKLCQGKMPPVQVQGLEKNPKINPTIIPEPRDWFIESFDWIVGLKLLRGETYGPFYRVDGDYFWPTIGNLYDKYSETACFFGMQKPKDIDEVKSLYNIMKSTKTDYIYEIIIEMPKWPIIDDAYIFLGAVKNGGGFQVNPNGRVVELLREKIINNKIDRFVCIDNKYNYDKQDPYEFIKEEAKPRTKDP